MDKPNRPDWLAAAAGYTLLACLFFWRILFTNQILAGFDTVTIFYPHRAAAVRALLAGRLPLWNPDHFLGAPLLANPQVAVFYPLNWPFLGLSVGLSLAATMALHYILAAVGMYLFARQRVGLNPLPAFFAGLLFAFGGFLGQQSGHLNQVSVAAWLPILLLLAGRAWDRPSGPRVAACAVVVALQLLAGHTQESYMILGALAAYLLFLLVTQGRPRPARESVRRGAALVAAVLMGAGLAAVQLVPTLELSSLSIRSGGLSYRQASSFSLNPQDLFVSLLPSYQSAPPNEMAGYVGVAGLLLAVLAVVHGWQQPVVRFLTLLAAVAFVLALGRYTPIYLAAYYALPGIALFRVPARWLLVSSFAIAVLAGLGLEIVRSRLDGAAARRAGLLLTGVCLAAAAVVAGGSAFLHLPRPATLIAWGAIAIGTLALVATPGGSQAGSATREQPPTPAPPDIRRLVQIAVRRYLPHPPSTLSSEEGYKRADVPSLSARLRLFRSWAPFLLVLVALAELWAAGRHLEYNRSVPPESVTALRPSIGYLQTQDQPIRVLSVSDATFDPGDLSDVRAMFPSLSAESTALYVDLVKNKELLTANLPSLFALQTADGYDGGVLPLRQYVDMQRLFLAADQVSPDGRLRDHLSAIPDARLLGLLAVNYAVTDKKYDVWVNDVYYDLAFEAPVISETTRTVDRPFVATAVGIVSRIEGAADLAPGTVVGRLTATDGRGRSVTIDLLADRHTGPVGSATLRHVRGPADRTFVHSVLPLDQPLAVERLTIRCNLVQGRLVLGALSLIDQRTGAGLALDVSTDFWTVHSGDVKIYRNRRALPLAYVVHSARVLVDGEDAIAVMRGEDFEATALVLLDGHHAAATAAAATLGGAAQPATAVIRSYLPEHVEIAVESASPGILVLLDSYYPGWQATVDGTAVPIMRANGLFRGVAVPAGRHEVVFAYRPRSLAVGAAVSLVSLVMVSAAALWPRRRIR